MIDAHDHTPGDPTDPDEEQLPAWMNDDSNRLPEWLEKLATESWQAELLISGFAIIGTSQLIGLIDPITEWIVFNVRTAYLSFLYWVLVYLSIGFYVLPVAFVLHFAIRTFWVGLIGLSSVFPEGMGPVRPRTLMPGYVERLERKYPALPSLIDKVERVASVLFSLAAIAAMLFASSAFVLLVINLIAWGISELTDGRISYKTVFVAIIGLYFVMWLISAILSTSGKLRDRPVAQRIYFAIQPVVSKISYTIFEYPTSYITTLLLTNVDMKLLRGPLIASYVVLLIGSIFVMTSPLIEAVVRPERVIEDAVRTDLYSSAKYADEHTDGLAVLSPYVTQRRYAVGAPIEVVLPELGEDAHRLGRLIGDLERADSLSDAEWRHFKREARLEAYGAYYRFTVDSQAVVPSVLRGYVTADDRDGALAIFEGLSEPSLETVIGVDTYSIDSARYEPRARIPIIIE